MDYCDIKHALCKKGYSITRVAKELGLFGPQSVQQVCMRKYASARTEKFIAAVTGISLEILFPDRYNAKSKKASDGGVANIESVSSHKPLGKKAR